MGGLQRNQGGLQGACRGLAEGLQENFFDFSIEKAGNRISIA